MNQKRAKHLRAKARELAAVWLKTLLPPDQAALVTPESVREFEKAQDQHVHANGRCVVSAYSTRYFYKKLKKAARRREAPDFTLHASSELGV